MRKMKNLSLTLLVILLTTMSLMSQDLSKKKFGFEDAMKFKHLRRASISDSAKYVAYELWPQRGDGVAVIQKTDSTLEKIEIARGIAPVIAPNERWAAAIVKAPALEIENAEKEKPDNGMALVSLATQEQTDFEKVTKFEFSRDSKWLAIYHKKDDKEKPKLEKKTVGSTLKLRHLNSGTDLIMENVTQFVLDTNSTYLFYAVSSPDGKTDGIYARELKKEFAPIKMLDTAHNKLFANLAWNHPKSVLAYTESELSTKGLPAEGDLNVWDFARDTNRMILNKERISDGLYIPSENELEWTWDGERLFFGTKEIALLDTIDTKKKEFTEENFFSLNEILEEADIKVWHWNDPLIATNREKEWNKTGKNKTDKAVFHLNSGKYVQLGNKDLPSVVVSQNEAYTIAYDDNPYQKEITYDGWYYDLYKVNLQTGEKKLVKKRIMEGAQISPNGSWIVYFDSKNWFSYSTKTDVVSNLTEIFEGDPPFWNEENDEPKEPGSYGFAGWFDNSDFFLAYDKYDIWRFSCSGTGNILNMTAGYGRENKLKCRVYNNLDKDKKYHSVKDTVYISMFSEKEKWQHPAILELPLMGPLILDTVDDSTKIYSIVAQAKYTDDILFTKESFDEYPDLWVATPFFESMRKVSDANPEIKDYTWGTTEVVEFTTVNGDKLQGYVIKPDNFNPKKKHPLLVYFYDQFSDRARTFYRPYLNHRPIYQMYLSDGYMVFLPDIKYHEGRPGMDATEALTAGVQSIIDSGWVDEGKVGLQGHSWAAYQGAYVISQTDMFKAAAVGAPVGNMTSAYSGIRLGTGLARQFQYEKTQSRIGGNLWDSLDAYIKNSPVFEAETINTPLLILHGNQDEAVPYEQGIELFLALRRLEKPVVMIEYEGEMHHPRKFKNQLDWSVKMKEWFDHYLLGKPAAPWIEHGLYYKGNLTPDNKTIYETGEE